MKWRHSAKTQRGKANRYGQMQGYTPMRYIERQTMRQNDGSIGVYLHAYGMVKEDFRRLFLKSSSFHSIGKTNLTRTQVRRKELDTLCIIMIEAEIGGDL